VGHVAPVPRGSNQSNQFKRFQMILKIVQTSFDPKRTFPSSESMK
jgi:hypothetical protein